MTPDERAQVIAALETGREAVTHMLWDHRLQELREALAIMRRDAEEAARQAEFATIAERNSAVIKHVTGRDV